MAVRFKRRGILFTADTPEEAAQMQSLLNEMDEAAALKRAHTRVLTKFEGPMANLREMVREEAEALWTPGRFFRFVDRLGSAQKAALALLVTESQVTDDALRKSLKIANNQALAGVLSGISKQAASLDIPARAIFSFENLRNRGRRRSTYRICESFRDTAKQMNWPPADLLES